jgi:hypothetical protein
MKNTSRYTLAFLIGAISSPVLFGQALSIAPTRSAELREQYELALEDWTAADNGIEKGLLQQDPGKARQHIALARRRWLIVSKAKIEMLQNQRSELDRTAALLDAEPEAYADSSFRNQLSNRLKELEQSDALDDVKTASTPQELLQREQRQLQAHAIQQLKHNLRAQMASLDDLGAVSVEAARVRRSLSAAVSDASQLLDHQIDLAKDEQVGFTRYYEELETLVDSPSAQEPAANAKPRKKGKKVISDVE